MKTKILEHVRNVCGLKKLEFGTLLRIKMTDEEVIVKPVQWFDECTLGVTVECEEIEINEIPECDYIEIIGLPVQLNHLLFAIGDRQDRCMFSDGSLAFFDTVSGTWIKKYRYNLQKTVEQNLEDEALCKLLVEVLNIK